MKAEPQFVTLKSGMSVPLEPVLLALDLERRGFEIRTTGSVENGDDELFIKPIRNLTTPEREQVRRWRDSIIVIVNAEHDASFA